MYACMQSNRCAYLYTCKHSVHIYMYVCTAQHKPLYRCTYMYVGVCHSTCTVNLETFMTPNFRAKLLRVKNFRGLLGSHENVFRDTFLTRWRSKDPAAYMVTTSIETFGKQLLGRFCPVNESRRTQMIGMQWQWRKTEWSSGTCRGRYHVFARSSWGEEDVLAALSLAPKDTLPTYPREVLRFHVFPCFMMQLIKRNWTSWRRY